MVYQLATEDYIYLFKLIKGTNIYYFCGVEGVIYQGILYDTLPCEITNYNSSVSGVTQPTFTVYSAKISGLIRQFNHLLNWELHVLKLKKSQLSSNNVLTQRPFDIFTITQKTSEVPNKLVSFKLKRRTNLKGTTGRVLTTNCNYVYRGDGCEYQGSAMFTVNNEITQDENLDICALTLTACKLRNNIENFGGVPTINDFS